MKKILLINGSPHEKGNTYFALNEAARTLTEQGFITEIVWIGTKPVRGCIACGGCVRAGDGHCVFNDDLCNEVIERQYISARPRATCSIWCTACCLPEPR